MEFPDVVRKRRMYRHFAAEPVAREVLERIAATAQRTPSAGFSQGQRIVIVTEPAMKRRLAELYHEQEMVDEGWDRWMSECAAIFVPCVSDEIYRARYREQDKLGPNGEQIEWLNRPGFRGDRMGRVSSGLGGRL